MKPVKHIAYNTMQQGPDERQASFTAKLFTSVVSMTLLAVAFLQFSDPLAMPQKQASNKNRLNRSILWQYL